ncbi:MAG: hypothetical protein QOH46_581 [Solirubrobacteraceae bacterium]|nr:hypothetical protein [Solirubrobacteraceae bacterium]
MHVTAPPIVPAPASRIGRHMRRTARRLGATAAVMALVLAALIGFAGSVAVAIGVAAATNVLLVGACRLLGANMHDGAEERWLRHALHDLRPADVDDDEEPDLLVS